MRTVARLRYRNTKSSFYAEISLFAHNCTTTIGENIKIKMTRLDVRVVKNDVARCDMFDV